MDSREMQEARTLAGALQTGQEPQASDYLRNVVLNEPRALEIITAANTQAGPWRRDSIGVYDQTGQVVLVQNIKNGQQFPVGQLNAEQMKHRQTDAPAVEPDGRVAAPGDDRFSQESSALAAALKSGDSDQAVAVMKSVLAEPNALAIIKHSNSLAGDDPPESIGLLGDQVVLITNNDHKQYPLGTLQPEQIQGAAAPVAPVDQSERSRSLTGPEPVFGADAEVDNESPPSFAEQPGPDYGHGWSPVGPSFGGPVFGGGDWRYRRRGDPDFGARMAINGFMQIIGALSSQPPF